jgi:hypothetical protein
MKTLLSPGAIFRTLSETVRRFPLAVVCIAVTAVLALLVVHDHEVNYRWWPSLWFALVSSVAVTLATEERWSRIRTVLATVGIAALWGVRCLFFPADYDDMTTAQWVELGVVCGAAFFAIFIAAYLRRDSDTDARWWNFSLRTVFRLILGWLFSGILFGGLMLAVFAVSELFDVDPPEELVGWIAVACGVVFAPLYVLAGVPRGDVKRYDELHPEPLLKVLALYILGTIMAVYALILYVYLAKIVITWELPNGWVSWLVTILGAGGLAMTLLLYPHRMRSENRVVEFLSRRTGVIIAPLLMLMTIGIARRIGDYGWTPNRAYILLLNLWFYAIYAWLFVVRGRRVKWILISAVIVALISSVGPWSLARIEARPDAESDLPAAQEEEGFLSDSVVIPNKPYTLAGEYENFAKIYWNSGDDQANGHISITQEDADLVISVEEDASATDAADTAASGEAIVRKFRISMREAATTREIRGEGFTLMIDECYGTRNTASDSLEVNFLEGFLFY